MLCKKKENVKQKQQQQQQQQLTEISWSAHDGFPEGLLSDDSGEAKIAELCLRHSGLRGEQDVLRLEVTVHYVLLVQVLQGYQDLVGGGGR